MKLKISNPEGIFTASCLAAFLIAVGIFVFYQTQGIEKTGTALPALQAAGYTEIVMYPVPIWECGGKSDVYSTGFKAIGPTGMPTSGVVCEGFFSRPYIRN